MSELLPCPFCGAPAELKQNVQLPDCFGVACTICLGRVASVFNNEEEAIAAWNSRAVPEWLNVLIHNAPEWLDVLIDNARRDADLFRHHEKVSDDRNIALKRGAQAETLEDAIRAAEAWMEGK